MGINLSPLSAREASIGSADDPYKKYWWAILAGFVLTGAWLCVPIMEPQVGSAHVDAPSKPSDGPGAEQNLDSADNPSGAPGSAIALSMDAAKRKGLNDVDAASMLYQAPAESGAAAGAPVGAAASLAQQLKDAGKAKSAGGWTEKAQSGFSAPHLAGGGLLGLGVAGGGSSASSGSGVFGSNNAQAEFGAAVGLHGDGGPETKAGFKALQQTANAVNGLNGSAEALHSGMSGVFDSGKGKKPGNIGSGMSAAMVDAHAALDAAPDNLKVNDPKLDNKKLPEPPAAPAPASNSNSMQQLGQEMAMMAATAVIGGMIPGVGGQMVMMMGMAMMQQHAASTAAANSSSGAANANQRVTGSTSGS